VSICQDGRMDGPDESRVSVKYVDGVGWVGLAEVLNSFSVTAYWDSHAPFRGPNRLEIAPLPESAQAPSGSALSGVTSAVLRAVPLEALAAMIWSVMEDAGEIASERREVENVGRAGHGRRFYAEIAEEYAELVSRGDRSPVATLARLQGVSAETVRARVKRARALGFLAGPPGGLATITKAALQLLERDGD
jgi:hypothetical protein